MIYLESKGTNGMTDFVIELDGLDLDAQTLNGLRYTDQYNSHAWMQATSIASVSYDSSNAGILEIWATMPDGNGYLFRFQWWANRNDPDAGSPFYFQIGSGTDPNAGGFQVYYSHYQGFNEAVPEMVEGHFPVFVVPELADAFDDGNGSHHQHVLGGKTYYMPEGLTLGTNAWHGDYPSYAAPGSGVSVEVVVSDNSNAGWDGAVVYVYELDTGLVAASFGCGPGENGSVKALELKANVQYVWDVRFQSNAILGTFTATRVDTGEQFLDVVLGSYFPTMLGYFELVVHVEDYSLVSLSASVIDGASASISTEWTPYTLANAAGWAVALNGGFGSVGSQWTGATLTFGSSGVINFPTSGGLQSIQVAVVDGSGNILHVSSAISVNTTLITITVDSVDAWGDGWNGNVLEFYGAGGGTAGSYTLDNGAGETVSMFLPAGDYTWALVLGSYANETSVTVTDPDGNVLVSFSGGTPTSGSFSLAGPAGSEDSGSGDGGAPGDGIDGGGSGGGFSMQEILSNSIPDYTLVTVGLDGHVDYVVQLLDWESDEADYLFYIRKGDNNYLAMESWAPVSPTADWATHSIVIQESPDNLTYIDFTDPSQAQGFMLAEVWQNGAAFSNSSKLTWMTSDALFNLSGHFFQTYIAPIDAPTIEGLMANAEGWQYPSTETALCVYSDQPYKVHFADGAFENLLQPQSMPYTGRNSFLMSGMGGMWVEGTVAGQNVSVSGRYSGPVFVDDALDSDTDIDKMFWGYSEYNVIDHSATVSGQDMMSFTKYGNCFVQIFEGDIIKFDYTVQIVGNEIQVTPPAGKDGTAITVRVMNQA